MLFIVYGKENVSLWGADPCLGAVSSSIFGSVHLTMPSAEAMAIPEVQPVPEAEIDYSPMNEDFDPLGLRMKFPCRHRKCGFGQIP